MADMNKTPEILKRGRPRKSNPKVKLLRVRMTEEEYGILSEIANNCNLTISEVVRLCINAAFSL